MRLAQARTCSGFMQLDHAVPSCGTVQNRQLWHRRGTVQLQHGPRGSQPSSQARRQWPRRYGCVLIARASAGADPVMHVRQRSVAGATIARAACTPGSVHVVAVYVGTPRAPHCVPCILVAARPCPRMAWCTPGLMTAIHLYLGSCLWVDGTCVLVH